MVSKRTFDIRDLTSEESLKTIVAREEDQGLRMDHFLCRHLPWMSRSAIQKLASHCSISCDAERLNGNRIKSSTRVEAGDRIQVRLKRIPKDLEDAQRDPPLKDVEVLYEDELMLVINKPAGVPVHPVGMNLHRTILTALHHLYRNPDDPEKDVHPRLVHRLDLETSGVLVVAKEDATLKALTAQFKARIVKKEYIAVVYGLLEADEGEIDLPLGYSDNPAVPYRQEVRAEDGHKAITRYEVIKRNDRLTWVRLLPQTGRKHQLRVHMAALGHPIVGDKIYGPDEKYYFKARYAPPGPEDLKELLLPRQALHAYKLDLVHPGRNAWISFEAPLPEEFGTLE
ncbi:MAG: RluA family pseudouridine synthase [Planctomycetota bacterium]